VIITAMVADSGSSRTATLAVGRLALHSVWLGIGSLPGGSQLALSSSDSSATLPSTVNVPASSLTFQFDVTTFRSRSAPP
jgi:hypothetical protein